MRLTYGEIMLLCEGHGTSAIYERHQEIVGELQAALTACETEREKLMTKRGPGDGFWGRNCAKLLGRINKAEVALEQAEKAKRDSDALYTVALQRAVDGEARMKKLEAVIRAILAADERGQGVQFKEAMDAAQQLVKRREYGRRDA